MLSGNAPGFLLIYVSVTVSGLTFRFHDFQIQASQEWLRPSWRRWWMAKSSHLKSAIFLRWNLNKQVSRSTRVSFRRKKKNLKDTDEEIASICHLSGQLQEKVSSRNRWPTNFSASSPFLTRMLLKKLTALLCFYASINLLLQVN